MKGRKTKNRHNLVTPGMAYLEGKQAGIKEVVEWVGKHGRMTYARASGEVTFDHINWQAFKKEKGL